NTAPVTLEVIPYNSAVQWVTVLVSKNSNTVLKKTFVAADLTKVSGNFQISFSLQAGGWYQLQVLQVIGATAYVSRHAEFGVGDIYVIAGQSNAANHAETKTQSKNPLVVMYDPETGNWAPCQDPLPFASVFSHLVGAGAKGQGSTWPELGDLLASEEQVPIGFLSTAMGGSPLKSWLPGGPAFNSDLNLKHQSINYNLYQRLLTSTQRLLAESKGFKMVLWHQGESDLENCNVANPALCDSVQYKERFMKLKMALDKDLNMNTRWMVAQTSFFPAGVAGYMQGQPCVSIKNLYAASGALLVSSQRSLWGSNNIVQGPSSDDLLDSYRFPGVFGGCVHFSYNGQAEMSKRWYASIVQARSATGQ
ncbi:MAG TPA: sialate O-acetylesterase, partial [Bdellovibrio sp.]